MRPRRLLVLGWLALVGTVASPPAVQAQTSCVGDDLVICPGDILVSDYLAGAVIRISPGGTRDPKVLARGFPALRGILADRFGSLLLTESVTDVVLHLDPETCIDPDHCEIGVVAGPASFIVPEEIVLYEAEEEFGYPQEFLLVADFAIQGVWLLDPVVGDPRAGIPPDIALGFPEGLAFDEVDRKLYITDTSTSKPGVYEWDVAEGTGRPVSLYGGFDTPKDVALEPERDGRRTLLVSDRWAQKVFRVDPNEPHDSNQTELVTTGLQAPVGLYVYQDDGEFHDRGDFLVADLGAGAVYRYSSDGALLETYDGGGQLEGPWRITVAGDISRRADRPFLVSDTEQPTGDGQGELYRLTPYREPDAANPAAAARLAVEHDLIFAAPSGIAVDTDGTVLLCDGGNQSDLPQALLRVDPDATPGREETVFENEPLFSPNRVAVHGIDGETVYFVADPDFEVEPGVGAILKIEVEGGSYTASPLLPPFDEENYLVEPVALAIDRDGLLVVLNRDVDIENPEERAPLVRVHPKRGFQKPLGLNPALIGDIVNPVDLAIDANGDILLADGGDPDQEIVPFIFRLDGATGAPNLSKSYGFDPQGQPLFDTLEGIALDENRELLVTDSGDPGNPDADPAVTRIDTTSGSMWIVDIGADESWVRPNGIALEQTAAPPPLADLDGDFVLDRFDNCLKVLNPDQVDTNSDGIGNRCDADYNNDGVVDVRDYLLLAQAWGATPGDTRYDEDLDSSPEAESGDPEYGIGVPEYILVASQWNRPPGPGLPGCDGKLPPPSACTVP